MAADLSGQVALVTGGGRGIGRAIATALAGAGAAVAVTARSADQLEETAATIAAAGGRAMALPADVTDREAVARCVSTVEAQLGPISLLVKNAGSGGVIGPLWEIDPDEWWRVQEVNLRGPMLCMHAVLPGMVARGAGRIINLGSYVGVRPSPQGSAYATGKAALLRLADSVAAEAHSFGVSVFTVSPGLVRTEMTEALWQAATRAGLSSEDLPSNWTPIEKTPALVLRLAAGEADALSGCFLHVMDDIDGLLARAAEIASGNLYSLRLLKLNGLLA
ncbi:MAG: SDR family NAD(P)-dependent oxidoreductase [Dehalococcoidia bacterium]